MIENFLTNQWKMGVLAGATPENAFDVQVGLGSTMTGEDILNGYMNITVKVAVTRPAEFIVRTFQQKNADVLILETSTGSRVWVLRHEQLLSASRIQVRHRISVATALKRLAGHFPKLVVWMLNGR